MFLKYFLYIKYTRNFYKNLLYLTFCYSGFLRDDILISVEFLFTILEKYLETSHIRIKE